MNRKMRLIMIMAAFAVILVIGAVAQQKSGDTAIDPVCGMTVVKATAKATYDYKGTTYYFCSTGCKESFAKEPEKYIKAEAKVVKGEEMAAPMGMDGGLGFPLLGPDVAWTVENTKDGVTIKITSKNAETVKALQERMTKHMAMMKKMKEGK